MPHARAQAGARAFALSTAYAFFKVALIAMPVGTLAVAPVGAVAMGRAEAASAALIAAVQSVPAAETFPRRQLTAVPLSAIESFDPASTVCPRIGPLELRVTVEGGNFSNGNVSFFFFPPIGPDVWNVTQLTPMHNMSGCASNGLSLIHI